MILSVYIAECSPVLERTSYPYSLLYITFANFVSLFIYIFTFSFKQDFINQFTRNKHKLKYQALIVS